MEANGSICCLADLLSGAGVWFVDVFVIRFIVRAGRIDLLCSPIAL